MVLLQAIPKEFFTLQSMLTLTGAAGATFVICNGLQKAFDFNPKWLALAISICISVYGVYLTTENRPSDYFVGLVNGFLIFCTAAGATHMGSEKSPTVAVAKGESGTSVTKRKRNFLSPWF